MILGLILQPLLRGAESIEAKQYLHNYNYLLVVCGSPYTAEQFINTHKGTVHTCSLEQQLKVYGLLCRGWSRFQWSQW